MRFVHLTDSHLTYANQRIYNIPIREVHLRIVDEINKLNQDIEFVIHTGDISDDGSAESYTTAVEIFSMINRSVYWIAGNHDKINSVLNFKNGKNIKSDKYFSINGTYFILLNSVVVTPDGNNRSSGILTPDELTFLRKSLYRTNSKPVVIALHHPPINSNTWKDSRMLINTSDFFEIINEYSNIKLVLYGHQHQAQETIINNVKFYSPPSASFQFDKNIKWGFENSPPGFGIINSITFECENRYIDYEITPIYEPK